jgi:hypothetical protein
MEPAMDALAAIFAAPAAASTAVDAAAGIMGAVARPFAEVFSALTPAEESESSDEGDDEASVLHDRIAERLQEILEAAGADAGDCATVSFDPDSDEVRVNHCASAGDEAAAAIAQDDQLMDVLRQMAEVDSADDEPLELLVQVA